MTHHTDPNAQHAVYAPSSAHRWSVCTASAEAIAAIGEQEEGEEAAEGTRAHDEIERCFMRESAVNPDHPAAYGVALVLDYVRQLPPGKLWIEQRVRLTDQIWGRCDVAHWHEESRVLTIVDYKNGFVNVEAEENEQLMIYAAASAYTHQLPIEWARLVVVQPNSFLPVPRVKQWPVDAKTLHAFASRVAAVPAGPKRFIAGEQCKYCPLFGRCPASQDVLAQLSAMLCHAPDAVPDAQFALFAAMEKPIEDWFENANKAKLKQSLASGKCPPGMKIVQGTTKLAWLDEAAARKAVLEKFGADALDPPTPTQAKKLGLDVSALAHQPPGGPILAPESDKRKPWAQKTAAEMFKGVG